MDDQTIYLVIGIGVDESISVGDRGTICPTWPDCDRSANGSTTEPASKYDETGYESVKGDGGYAAIGARVFDEEYAARGWLEYSEAGQRFKKSFLNVLVVRSTI